MQSASAKKKAKKSKKTSKKKSVRNTDVAASSSSRPVDKQPRSKDFYSVPEVAAMEKVALKTVYAWLAASKLPGSRRATETDKKYGFDPGEWMIPKKGYKRPPGWKTV